MEYSRVERQKKLLKGFEKVLIRAGETASVKILIPIADLRIYSIIEKGWVLEPGTYVIMVGPCAADSSLSKTWLQLG